MNKDCPGKVTPNCAFCGKAEECIEKEMNAVKLKILLLAIGAVMAAWAVVWIIVEG
jgi:hypothetical protein